MSSDKQDKETIYQTIKIHKTTLKLLRKLHAETDESILGLIDRLAKEEWYKIMDERLLNDLIE